MPSLKILERVFETLGGGLGTGLNFFQLAIQQQAADAAQRRADNPFGAFPADSNFDFSGLGPAFTTSPNAGALQESAIGLARNSRFGIAPLAEFGELERARGERAGILNDQFGRTESLISQRGGEARNFGKEQIGLLDETISNPNVLSDAEIDRLVSESLFNQSKATAATLRGIDQTTARAGLSPSARSSLQNRALETDTAANFRSLRDVQNFNTLASVGRKDRAIEQRGDFGLDLQKVLNSIGFGGESLLRGTEAGLLANTEPTSILDVFSVGIADRAAAQTQVDALRTGQANTLGAVGQNLTGVAAQGSANRAAASAASDAASRASRDNFVNNLATVLFFL